ncbi:hypothetical protein [Cohnella sp. JJ-181]|uniref:hypothetical protein n=1 Tax=Cohnella rhizoplanae TaxID=2974897 RepID=UPI0022FF9D93|nr:hypothetical protein [Cohnella sp. JJ-181]CAI6081707.1 hypothetical protein COHCIP112018_03400 [Cohnella sp. JJ-181]
MKTAWLIMAGVAAIELYRLRQGNKRTRYMALTVWLLCIGYVGIAAFGEWLPLPVLIIRGLLGWTHPLFRSS